MLYLSDSMIFDFKIFHYEKINSIQYGCGTELLPAQTEYMNATREAREAYRAQAVNLKAGNITINIPIIAHIIRQADGTGGLSDADATTSIEQLNDQFDDPDLDVFFEHCITNYINDDDLYEVVSYSTSPGITSEYVMANSYIEGAINVFFVPNPTGWIPIFPVGGWASFPAYKDRFSKDWIVMSNAHATNGSTLAHEVGHYFAGNTSYVNDDDCLYDPTIAGTIPSLPTGYTMSDYNPDETNIMSYSDRDCTNAFSAQQKARMLESIGFDRSYLENTCSAFTFDCRISDFELIPKGISAPCNDNDTPNNPDDDWREMKVEVYYHWAENDVLNIQTSVETISVSVPKGRGIVKRDIRVPANGQANTATAYFSDNPSCSETATSPAAFTSCSVSQPCESNVNISTTYAVTDDLVVESSNYITAQNTIVQDGADVVYSAATYISNFPNPFTGQTTIAFSLSHDSPVTLIVSDATGRQVATLLTNEMTTSGTHEVTFDGTRHAAGVYYYTIQAGDYGGTQKMILVK